MPNSTVRESTSRALVQFSNPSKSSAKRHPTVGRRSSTRTRSPPRAKVMAAARPEGPAPTITRSRLCTSPPLLHGRTPATCQLAYLPRSRAQARRRLRERLHNESVAPHFGDHHVFAGLWLTAGEPGPPGRPQLSPHTHDDPAGLHADPAELQALYAGVGAQHCLPSCDYPAAHRIDDGLVEQHAGPQDHEIDHECHGQREDEEHRQADNRQKKGEMAHLGGAPAFDPDVLTLDRKFERRQGPGCGSGEHFAGGREDTGMARAEEAGVVGLPLDDTAEMRADPRKALVRPVLELQERAGSVLVFEIDHFTQGCQLARGRHPYARRGLGVDSGESIADDRRKEASSPQHPAEAQAGHEEVTAGDWGRLSVFSVHKIGSFPAAEHGFLY